MQFGLAIFLILLGSALSMAEPRRIALVSDPHVDAAEPLFVSNFARVIDDVNAAKVDAVLIAGDLAAGTTESTQQFAAMAKRFAAPVRWVAGNHDIGNKPMPDNKGGPSAERIATYRENLGDLFFASDVRPGLRVIGIASSLLDTGLPAEAEQWAMLEKELAAGPVVLLMHYPPFVTSADEPEEYFNLNAPARKRLLGLIEKGRVTAALSGHLHRPISLKLGSTPLIGAPAVSFGLPKGRQPVGWTLVSIDDAGRVTAENRYLPKPSDRVEPSDRVQIFYYNWYGAPPQQKGYVHWQQGDHVPPEDVGSNFYPKLGAYSSTDPAVLKQHMAWIRQAGIGVLCLTWWGQDSYEDKGTPAVLDAAAAAGLKVNFHLEPCAGHTPDKLAADVKYLLAKYGKHAAFYRASGLGNKPVFYVFEIVRHPSAVWKAAVDQLRTDVEPFLIFGQTSDVQLIQAGGFDGGYLYDGLAPFKDAGFPKRWSTTAAEFNAAGKLFVPSVGPGYWDDRAVPRGADEPESAKTRDDGQDNTYDAAWEAAVATDPPFITITSFNEWHEGSQIEPAVATSSPQYNYPAYRDGERQYLDLTAYWTERFARSLEKGTP